MPKKPLPQPPRQQVQTEDWDPTDDDISQDVDLSVLQPSCLQLDWWRKASTHEKTRSDIDRIIFMYNNVKAYATTSEQQMKLIQFVVETEDVSTYAAVAAMQLHRRQATHEFWTGRKGRSDGPVQEKDYEDQSWMDNLRYDSQNHVKQKHIGD